MATRQTIRIALFITTMALNAHAADVSGLVWEDVNTNGVREAGEPLFTNALVFLQRSSPWLTFTNTTDAAGSYLFTNAADGNYQIHVLVDPKYDITSAYAGTNANEDSDLVYYSTFTLTGSTVPFDISGTSISNLDAGFKEFTPGIRLTVTAGTAAEGQPLYVTNGTHVPFVYKITNTGDVALSAIFSYDINQDAFVAQLDCPNALPDYRNSFITTNTRVVTISETNQIQTVGFAVNAYCGLISSLVPAQSQTQTVVIVVTNDPVDFIDGDNLPNWWEQQYGLDPLNSNALSKNSDTDWMTDLEEFWADTVPTNAESYLPNARIVSGAVTLENSSTNRLYRTWWSTNLNDEPQQWNIVSEKIGTGSTVTFAVSNDVPTKVFRTGVVAP